MPSPVSNTPIRPDLFQRDMAAVRRYARELLRQCDHYERNGPGDECRFGFMYLEARAALYYARRADRRYAKEHGLRPLA